LLFAEKNYDQAFAQTVTEQVFLLSVQQLKQYIYDQRDILGVDYHKAKPTPEAVRNNKYQSSIVTANRNWYYWLNTPYAMQSHQVRSVSLDGNVYYNNAYNFVTGVRPAIHFDLPLAMFNEGGAGTLQNPYVVKRNEKVNLKNDQAAPTAPKNLKTSMNTNRQVTIRWDASTDLVGVVGYDILLDGKKIIFASDRNNRYDLYQMNPDGSEVTRLTNLDYFSLSPHCQPIQN
jgi:hypothetical protein